MEVFVEVSDEMDQAFLLPAAQRVVGGVEVGRQVLFRSLRRCRSSPEKEDNPAAMALFDRGSRRTL